MRIQLEVHINGRGPTTCIEIRDVGAVLQLVAPSDDGRILYTITKLEWARLMHAGNALLLEDNDGNANS